MAGEAGVRQGDAFAAEADPTFPGARQIVGRAGAQVSLRRHVALALAGPPALIIPFALALPLAFSLPVLFPVLGCRGEWDSAETEARRYGGRHAQKTAAVSITDQLPVKRIEPVHGVHGSQLSCGNDKSTRFNAMPRSDRPTSEFATLSAPYLTRGPLRPPPAAVHREKSIPERVIRVASISSVQACQFAVVHSGCHPVLPALALIRGAKQGNAQP
jgi:hypothetical protein